MAGVEGGDVRCHHTDQLGMGAHGKDGPHPPHHYEQVHCEHTQGMERHVDSSNRVLTQTLIPPPPHPLSELYEMACCGLPIGGGERTHSTPCVSCAAVALALTRHVIRNSNVSASGDSEGTGAGSFSASASQVVALAAEWVSLSHAHAWALSHFVCEWTTFFAADVGVVPPPLCATLSDGDDADSDAPRPPLLQPAPSLSSSLDKRVASGADMPSPSRIVKTTKSRSATRRPVTPPPLSLHPRIRDTLIVLTRILQVTRDDANVRRAWFHVGGEQALMCAWTNLVASVPALRTAAMKGATECLASIAASSSSSTATASAVAASTITASAAATASVTMRSETTEAGTTNKRRHADTQAAVSDECIFARQGSDQKHTRDGRDCVSGKKQSRRGKETEDSASSPSSSSSLLFSLSSCQHADLATAPLLLSLSGFTHVAYSTHSASQFASQGGIMCIIRALVACTNAADHGLAASLLRTLARVLQSTCVVIVDVRPLHALLLVYCHLARVAAQRMTGVSPTSMARHHAAATTATAVGGGRPLRGRAALQQTRRNDVVDAMVPAYTSNVSSTWQRIVSGKGGMSGGRSPPGTSGRNASRVHERVGACRGNRCNEAVSVDASALSSEGAGACSKANAPADAGLCAGVGGKRRGGGGGGGDASREVGVVSKDTSDVNPFTEIAADIVTNLLICLREIVASVSDDEGVHDVASTVTRAGARVADLNVCGGGGVIQFDSSVSIVHVVTAMLTQFCASNQVCQAAAEFVTTCMLAGRNVCGDAGDAHAWAVAGAAPALWAPLMTHTRVCPVSGVGLDAPPLCLAYALMDALVMLLERSGVEENGSDASMRARGLRESSPPVAAGGTRGAAAADTCADTCAVTASLDTIMYTLIHPPPALLPTFIQLVVHMMEACGHASASLASLLIAALHMLTIPTGDMCPTLSNAVFTAFLDARGMRTLYELNCTHEDDGYVLLSSAAAVSSMVPALSEAIDAGLSSPSVDGDDEVQTENAVMWSSLVRQVCRVLDKHALTVLDNDKWVGAAALALLSCLLHRAPSAVSTLRYLCETDEVNAVHSVLRAAARVVMYADFCGSTHKAGRAHASPSTSHADGEGEDSAEAERAMSAYLQHSERRTESRHHASPSTHPQATPSKTLLKADSVQSVLTAATLTLCAMYAAAPQLVVMGLLSDAYLTRVTDPVARVDHGPQQHARADRAAEECVTGVVDAMRGDDDNNCHTQSARGNEMTASASLMPTRGDEAHNGVTHEAAHTDSDGATTAAGNATGGGACNVDARVTRSPHAWVGSILDVSTAGASPLSQLLILVGGVRRHLLRHYVNVHLIASRALTACLSQSGVVPRPDVLDALIRLHVRSMCASVGMETIDTPAFTGTKETDVDHGTLEGGSVIAAAGSAGAGADTCALRPATPPPSIHTGWSRSYTHSSSTEPCDITAIAARSAITLTDLLTRDVVKVKHLPKVCSRMLEVDLRTALQSLIMQDLVHPASCRILLRLIVVLPPLARPVDALYTLVRAYHRVVRQRADALCLVTMALDCLEECVPLDASLTCAEGRTLLRNAGDAVSHKIVHILN